MAQVLFISHGAPAPRPDHCDSTWRALADRLQRPARIVIASSHWSGFPTRVTGSPAPATLHDADRVPAALHDLRYPVAGDPGRARQLACRLSAVGLQSWVDGERGLDHGMWEPLRHLYPEADIPVVGISISARHDSDWHYHLGRQLAQILDDDTLLICSGSFPHDPSDGQDCHDTAAGCVDAFQSWIRQQLALRDDTTLLDYRRRAPGVTLACPGQTPLLPLFVALGAGDTRAPRHFHASTPSRATAMEAWLFERASIDHDLTQTRQQTRLLVSVGR